MVILTIYVKSSIATLGQPLRKRLPASDCADPQILHRSRGKRHHHGDDVCGRSCVCVDGTFRTIPSVGNLWSGSFLFPPKSFLLPPELFRTQIGVKLLKSAIKSVYRIVAVHWSPWLNSAKVSEFSKPTMALFANITSANLKKGDIIMFAMVSSCWEQVDPWAYRCLGGQFVCAPMYYGVFLTIFNVTMAVGGCLWGVFWQRERVLHRILNETTIG